MKLWAILEFATNDFAYFVGTQLSKISPIENLVVTISFINIRMVNII